MVLTIDSSNKKAHCKACKTSIDPFVLRGKSHSAFQTSYYHLEECFLPPEKPLLSELQVLYVDDREDKFRKLNATIRLHEKWLRYLDRKGPDSWNDILSVCFQGSSPRSQLLTRIDQVDLFPEERWCKNSHGTVYKISSWNSLPSLLFSSLSSSSLSSYTSTSSTNENNSTSQKRSHSEMIQNENNQDKNQNQNEDEIKNDEPERKRRKLNDNDSQPQSSSITTTTSTSNSSMDDTISLLLSENQLSTPQVQQMIMDDGAPGELFIHIAGQEMASHIFIGKILPFLIGEFKGYSSSSENENENNNNDNNNNEKNDKKNKNSFTNLRLNYIEAIDHSTAAKHLNILGSVSKEWKELLDHDSIWQALLITHILRHQPSHSRTVTWNASFLQDAVQRVRDFIERSFPSSENNTSNPERIPFWKLVYLLIMTETCSLCCRTVTNHPLVSHVYIKQRYFSYFLQNFMCHSCFKLELELLPQTQLKNTLGSDIRHIIDQLHPVPVILGNNQIVTKYITAEARKHLLPIRSVALETARAKLITTVRKKLKKRATDVEARDELETLERWKATPELVDKRDGIMRAWTIKDSAVCSRFRTAKKLWEHILKTKQDKMDNNDND